MDGLAESLCHDLVGKHFIATDDLATATQLVATRLRTRMAYLRDFTALHMIVLTYRCTCRCDYCQAASVPRTVSGLDMSVETARKVVDTILQSPAPAIKIEFQGGEPTLNWETLQFIVKYARRRNHAIRRGRALEFVVCTNLTDVTADMLSFCASNGLLLSSSLDGPQELHDAHRVHQGGKSAHAAFMSAVPKARHLAESMLCAPLSTITSDHLSDLRSIVDEYRRCGFGGVFLRPVNPYGGARTHWNALGCSVDGFVDAYKDALDYIIEINLSGERFAEYYAQLLLTRILTPFSTGFVDLQSPTGAGISGAIYDYDGSVYPSDEARMLARSGDRRFRMGSVHEHTYEELFGGDLLRSLVAHSWVGSLPGCAWCAYSPYCGVDPIRYYVECGDPVGHRPSSSFCQKQIKLFDHLFGLIKGGDRATMDVFWSWITNRSIEEVRS